MLALIYDIHGNLPALEAVLADAAEHGADAYLVGGDVALFGPWPEATVDRLQELAPATWIRGNGECWTADREAAPPPVRGAVDAARAALGMDLVAELDGLPTSTRIDDASRAWHGSPVSDVRSFLPEPADDEAELLSDVTDARLIFGHTHLPFRRASAIGVELVNPGSVGMPFDGDHRAAYAVLHDDGEIEHRRVAYDHAGVPRALRARYGDADWLAGCIASRTRASRVPERAAMERTDEDPALRLAIALARELLHGTAALRVRVALAGAAPAIVECERMRAVVVRRAGETFELAHDAADDVALPALPFMRRLPAFDVEPRDGRVAGVIGGLEMLGAAVRDLASLLPAGSVVAADYETSDPALPLGLAGRAGEAVVVLLGDDEFALAVDAPAT
jgi:predicted phosphodiesterase